MGCGANCGCSPTLWNLEISGVKMNFELLSWLGNFINFLIFLFLAINIVSTSCFSSSQMFLSIFGLLASIFIQAVAVLSKLFLRKND